MFGPKGANTDRVSFNLSLKKKTWESPDDKFSFCFAFYKWQELNDT